MVDLAREIEAILDERGRERNRKAEERRAEADASRAAEQEWRRVIKPLLRSTLDRASRALKENSRGATVRSIDHSVTILVNPASEADPQAGGRGATSRNYTFIPKSKEVRATSPETAKPAPTVRRIDIKPPTWSLGDITEEIVEEDLVVWLRRILR